MDLVNYSSTPTSIVRKSTLAATFLIAPNNFQKTYLIARVDKKLIIQFSWKKNA